MIVSIVLFLAVCIILLLLAALGVAAFAILKADRAADRDHIEHN